jgi:hypothetical protein
MPTSSSSPSPAVCDHGYNTMLSNGTDPYKAPMNVIARTIMQVPGHGVPNRKETTQQRVDKSHKMLVECLGDVYDNHIYCYNHTLTRKMIATGLKKIKSNEAEVLETIHTNKIGTGLSLQFYYLIAVVDEFESSFTQQPSHPPPHQEVTCFRDAILFFLNRAPSSVLLL